MNCFEFDNWLVEQARAMPCAMNKGDNSKAQEAISNQISQQQIGMETTAFNETNPAIKNIIAGGGMLPQQEAALRAQTINQLPQQFNQLYGNLSQQLTARGLTGGQFGAGGGGVAAGYGSLGAAEAGIAQQGEFNIAGMKMQGLESALGLGNQQLGATAQAGTTANSTAQAAGKAADEASTGFWGSLFGALGTAAGGWLGKCWVLRAVYGEDDFRPKIVWFVWDRKWSVESRWSRTLQGLYVIFGEYVGWIVKRTPIRKWIRPWTDKAVERAIKDLNA